MGCIYMYTNKINGKRYVGQTTRTLEKRHCQHLFQHESYFDRALQKYGEDNFTLEILADNIVDIDELNRLEEYYIEKYDTFNNGYNLNRGGNNQTRFSKEDRDRIIDLLIHSNLSFQEISEQTGYGFYTISSINRGETLPREDIVYPARKRRRSEKYSEEDYLKIVELIKNTDLSFNDIAEKTGFDFSLICDINRGKRVGWGSRVDIDFPIRQNVKKTRVTKELGEQVIALLKKNDMSADEIGDFLGIPGYTVGSINRGKHSICKQLDEDYPIRKKEYKNPSNRISSREELKKVLDLLLFTKLSMEEIAQRVGVSKSTITAINTGRNYCTQNSSYKFPIRQNKDYNIKIFSGVKE